MDGRLFDRMAKTLSDSTARREAINVLVSAGLATAASFRNDDADAKKKKKKRCLERRAPCGGKEKCCNNSGLIRCREFPARECSDFSGRHCCGLDGALCFPANEGNLGGCDCCDPLFCVPENGVFRCREEDT